MSTPIANNRVLVVDDNGDVLDIICKILNPTPSDDGLENLLQDVLGQREEGLEPWSFEVTTTTSGREALEAVSRGVAEGSPFAVAFVDVRMPPGLDGIETVAEMWKLDPNVQVVICSAYSDYSWPEMAQRLPRLTQWLVLKKPFSSVEVLQCAHSLAMKWHLDKVQRESMAAFQQGMHRCAEGFGDLREKAGRGRDDWKQNLQVAIQETQRCIEQMRSAFEEKL